MRARGRSGALPAGRAGPSPRPQPRCRPRPCRRWPRARSPRSRGCAPPGERRGRCRDGPSAGGRRPRRPAPHCAGSSAAARRQRRQTAARPAPAPRGAAAASSRRSPAGASVLARACVCVCVCARRRGAGCPGHPAHAAGGTVPAGPVGAARPRQPLCSFPALARRWRPPSLLPRRPSGLGRAPAALAAPAVRSPRLLGSRGCFPEMRSEFALTSENPPPDGASGEEAAGGGPLLLAGDASDPTGAFTPVEGVRGRKPGGK